MKINEKIESSAVIAMPLSYEDDSDSSSRLTNETEDEDENNSSQLSEIYTVSYLATKLKFNESALFMLKSKHSR